MLFPTRLRLFPFDLVMFQILKKILFKVQSPRNVALKEKQKAASKRREESRKLGEQKEKKQLKELEKNKKHINDLREKTLRLRKRHMDDREQRVMQEVERSLASTMKDVKREQRAAKLAEKMKRCVASPPATAPNLGR